MSNTPANHDHGLRRLAVTLAEANHSGDEQTVLDVLATIRVEEAGAFLVALSDLVFHAFSEDPEDGFDTFIDHYRQLIETHENSA
ncbi:hypothetical protein [Nesterenkonia haasae]|uniref:hypothetical protein n=1 Tax=Nesterenkonia haasae TaxID=2587813 RepID=UPI00139113B8|nr:hypothetical protein [Nesterenkonia haasae]NDK33027.1 hypothetical protein [Nesterenkonia haasae]